MNTLPQHLHILAKIFQSLQRDRVGLELAIQARQAHDPELIDTHLKLEQLEKKVLGQLVTGCNQTSIWPWLQDVKGVGPRLGGMLIGHIDIARAPTVSALWRYAGLAVMNGQAEHREKGQKLHYNHVLKKTCFLIARSFLMAESSPYVEEYQKAKTEYMASRPDWTPKHRDLAARRKMVKLFLSHLWVTWREAEGLPVRLPYAHEKLGHTTLIPPK